MRQLCENNIREYEDGQVCAYAFVTGVRRLGLAPWAKPNLRPNLVSQ